MDMESALPLHHLSVKHYLKVNDEILSSEQTYLKLIKLLIDYFEDPIKDNKYLISEDVSKVFGNIQQLYDVGQELLNHLQEYGVGSAFLRLAPFLKLYSLYASNHAQSLTVLQMNRQRNQQLDKFISNQESRPEVGLKIEALMIMPIQRIPRYKLLLEELLKHSQKGGSDYFALSEAVSKVSKVACHINDHMKELENFQKMIAIQKSLEGDENSFKIVVPGRKFVKEGLLKKVSRKGDKMQLRMFFLFSDILIYAKQKLLSDSSSNSKYNCSCVFPLRLCKVDRMFGGMGKGVLLKLTCQNESVLVCTDSQEDADSWIQAIESTALESIQNRLTLRKESSAKRVIRRMPILNRKSRKRPKSSMENESPTNFLCLPREGLEKAIYTSPKAHFFTELLNCSPLHKPGLSSSINTPILNSESSPVLAKTKLKSNSLSSFLPNLCCTPKKKLLIDTMKAKGKPIISDPVTIPSQQPDLSLIPGTPVSMRGAGINLSYDPLNFDDDEEDSDDDSKNINENGGTPSDVFRESKKIRYVKDNGSLFSMSPVITSV